MLRFGLDLLIQAPVSSCWENVKEPASRAPVSLEVLLLPLLFNLRERPQWLLGGKECLETVA